MTRPRFLLNQKTPEEIELEKKRVELSILEEELAIKEMDLTTLQADLEDLRRRYLRIIGVKLAKLDDLEAQIAEILSRYDPNNKSDREKAERSRNQAQESANTAGSISEKEYKTEPFNPSENLKQLYRELAKKVHPDLAPDDGARKKRHRLMQEVNQAYKDGNEAGMRVLLNEWLSSPDSVSGEGTGAELIRLIRQISTARIRFQTINQEMDNHKKLVLYKLKLMIDEAKNQDRDLLAEMAAAIERQIGDAYLRRSDASKRVDIISDLFSYQNYQKNIIQHHGSGKSI